MHQNITKCLGCEQVLDKYPNFYQPLRDWFYSFRTSNLDAHCSWGGRGAKDQELFFNKGLSHAHWGQSAHNYNAALDFFRLTQTNTGLTAQFDSPWYRNVLGPATDANPNLRWYGKPPITFFELPHVEWANWRVLRDAGKLNLVE